MKKINSIKFHEKYKGKLNISSAVSINSKDVLSAVYTPGVGEVCKQIHKNPRRLYDLTIAGRTIAVISNGTAVLGFGDLGPKAALPVMEGKSAIFKELAGIQSYPICIDEQDPKKFIEIVKAIALNFRAINLEDISAPSCFEIENQLSKQLTIPVVHDDQHGTAIVTLSALLSALKLKGNPKISIVINGAGAAGNAITKILVHASKYKLINAIEIKVFDTKGLISNDRNDLDKYKQELANITNQNKFVNFDKGISGTDVFIGVSVKGVLNTLHIKSMNEKPIIFAMANPDPEIIPNDALSAGAFIVATGRSDFDNQINNALAYPGMFKGLLTSNVKSVTIEHKLAVAKAIYEYNLPNLTTNNLLPSLLDKNVPIIIEKEIINLK